VRRALIRKFRKDYIVEINRRAANKVKAPKVTVVTPNSHLLDRITPGLAENWIPKMAPHSVDMVFTSLEYGGKGIPILDYPKTVADVMRSFLPIVKPEGSVFLVLNSSVQDQRWPPHLYYTVPAILATGWHMPFKPFTWIKPDGRAASHERPRDTTEELFWFCKTDNPYMNLKECGNLSKRIGRTDGIDLRDDMSTIGTHIRCPIGFLDDKGYHQNEVKHRHRFPTVLAGYFILSFSEEGQVVLDPFAGTASTGLAAQAFRRHFFAIEKDPAYRTIANRRLREEKYQPGTAHFEKAFRKMLTNQALWSSEED
jgi:DNA modification methylase